MTSRASRLADRGLQPRLDSRQALNPGVDHAERDRCEVVRVEAHVKLMPVRAMVARVGVPVE